VATSQLVDVELEWEPLNGETGARVTGVDLRTVDADWVAACRKLTSQRCVLVLPGQHLDGPALVRFARLWGEPYITKASTKKSDEYPELMVMRNEGKANTDTETWHSDVSFLERPPAFGILAAQLVPYGGDTIFANQYLAYETLSPQLKDILLGLSGVHEHLRLATNYGLDKAWNVHPAVRTNPDSGNRGLFVSSCYTTRFEGMTKQESAGLLNYLTAHAVSPEFCYRHHWTEGDVVIWDNRCAQHYAVHDYGDQPRTLLRAAIAGERPE
jgi:taurine dioxygenase